MEDLIDTIQLRQGRNSTQTSADQLKKSEKHCYAQKGVNSKPKCIFWDKHDHSENCTAITELEDRRKFFPLPEWFVFRLRAFRAPSWAIPRVDRVKYRWHRTPRMQRRRHKSLQSLLVLEGKYSGYTWTHKGPRWNGDIVSSEAIRRH